MKMPTSARGITNNFTLAAARRRARGFTLLEILVVVAIIAVFVGVAVLSTDLVAFDRRLEQQARRLESVLRYAGEEALLQTVDYGLLFDETGYRFVYFDQTVVPPVWRLLQSEILAPYQLEDDMEFALTIDDAEVDLDPADLILPVDESEDGLPPPYPPPHVMLLSSGEVTPFELEFLRISEPFEPGFELAVAFDGGSEVRRGEL